jgi:SLBB domain
MAGFGGSALVTLSGAVASPGVYEIEHGMPLDELLDIAGITERLTAVLLGGYFGSWLPAAQIRHLRLVPELLADHGASLGCGVIVALGETACLVAEAARIADYFAAHTAGQCGPCVNGLQRSRTPYSGSRPEPRTGLPGRTSSGGRASCQTEAPASIPTAPFGSSRAPCGYSKASSMTTPATVGADAARSNRSFPRPPL